MARQTGLTEAVTVTVGYPGNRKVFKPARRDRGDDKPKTNQNPGPNPTTGTNPGNTERVGDCTKGD